VQSKLFGIINVAFDQRGQLLITHFAFAKHNEAVHQMFMDFMKVYKLFRM